MSRSLSRPMRVPVSRSSPSLRGRSGDSVSRRILLIGGALLAAIMLILSTQTSGARTTTEVIVEVPSVPAES